MLSSFKTNTPRKDPLSPYKRDVQQESLFADNTGCHPLIHGNIYTWEERNQQFFCFNLCFDLEASVQHS